MKDVLHWKPEQIGVVLFLVGVVDIIAQGFLIRKLSAILSESRLAIIGLAIVIVGYLTLTAIPILHISSLIYVGAILFALGDGLFEPSISGLISATASRSEQGRVQGAHQSIQSIARIFGPIMVTFIYPFGANLVYFTSAFITFASLLSIMIILPVIRRRIAL
jgi:DHA1 family tetracycline resistance protein-like MFS transporter